MDKQAVLIERLNSLATQLATQGNSTIDALEMAANNYDLDELESSEGDVCRIYKRGDIHVNCWMEGVLTSSVAEGGAGFDDQTDWYFEDTDA
jgi:hypothetical protein